MKKILVAVIATFIATLCRSAQTMMADSNGVVKWPTNVTFNSVTATNLSSKADVTSVSTNLSAHTNITTGAHGIGTIASKATNAYLSVDGSVAMTGSLPMDSQSISFGGNLLSFDTSDYALAFNATNLSDATLQIGQETYVLAKNESGSDVTNGQAVYINGASGFRVTFDLATATNGAPDKCVGLATHNIAKNQLGFITMFGLVRNLNTVNLIEGGAVYLGNVRGSLATNAGADKYIIGTASRIHASLGSVFVEPHHVPFHDSDAISVVATTYPYIPTQELGTAAYMSTTNFVSSSDVIGGTYNHTSLTNLNGDALYRHITLNQVGYIPTNYLADTAYLPSTNFLLVVNATNVFVDAPSDANSYARKSNAWSAIPLFNYYGPFAEEVYSYRANIAVIPQPGDTKQIALELVNGITTNFLALDYDHNARVGVRGGDDLKLATESYVTNALAGITNTGSGTFDHASLTNLQGDASYQHISTAQVSRIPTSTVVYAESDPVAMAALTNGTVNANFANLFVGGGSGAGADIFASSDGIADGDNSCAVAGGTSATNYSFSACYGVALGLYSVGLSGGGAAEGATYAVGLANGQAYGVSSFAANQNSVARGNKSFASAEGIAEGEKSFATGSGESYGFAAFASGGGVASGRVSVAMSHGRANGFESIAFSGGHANGSNSIAWGRGATTDHDFSIVLADSNSASSATNFQFTASYANGFRFLGGAMEGNGSGITNIAASNVVGLADLDTNYVAKTGDTVTGAILTTRTAGFSATELVPAQWVRELVAVGTPIYLTTNLATVGWTPTNTTLYGHAEVPASTFNFNVTVTGANQYVSSMITTNTITGLLRSPVTAEIFLSSPGGAQRSLSAKPEIYWTTNKADLTITNGDFSAAAQVITCDGTTNRYTFSIAFPEITVTNAYIVARLKTTAVGNNTTNVVFTGGNGTASFIQFRTPTESTSSGTDTNTVLALIGNSYWQPYSVNNAPTTTLTKAMGKTIQLNCTNTTYLTIDESGWTTNMIGSITLSLNLQGNAFSWDTNHIAGTSTLVVPTNGPSVPIYLRKNINLATNTPMWGSRQ